MPSKSKPAPKAPKSAPAKMAAPKAAPSKLTAPTQPAARVAKKAGSSTPAVDPGMIPAFHKAEDGQPTAPGSVKNYRNHPDMENFFRFIFDNDLRIEALQIIDEIITTRQVRRAQPKFNA